MKKTLFLLIALIFTSTGAFAATYQVDAAHTSVSFKVKHLLSKTQGQFNKFTGTIDYDPAMPESWSAQGTIEVASLDTNVADRDKHLLSAEFFDVEKNPTIEFRTTGVKEATATSAKVEGVLKMLGIEKPVILDVTIGGIAKDPWGNTRSAFSATTKINRKDYGMTWNKTLDQGNLLLGEEVEISLEVEAILQAPKATAVPATT